MALTLGERLGVYEVRELIGAGGMGEVETDDLPINVVYNWRAGLR